MGDYDEETAFLGQIGPFFWLTFFLLNTVFVSTGFNGLYIIFAGAAPKHSCLVPDVNLTEEWRNAIIPFTIVDDEAVQSQCSRYNLAAVKNLSDQGYIPGRDVNLTNLPLEGCLDGWNYSKEVYQSTIVTEVSMKVHLMLVFSCSAGFFSFVSNLCVSPVEPCLWQPMESPFCIFHTVCGISVWLSNLRTTFWQVFHPIQEISTTFNSAEHDFLSSTICISLSQELGQQKRVNGCLKKICSD